MKIAHVVRQFHPSIGGLEDYVFNLATEQLAAGHQVRVITLNTDFQTNEQLADHETYKGIEIIRLPWKGSTRYPLCRPDLAALNAVDIVHVHAVDYLIDYLSLMKRTRRLTSTLILSTHGGFFHTEKNQLIKKAFFQTITRFTIAKADAVLCCSSNDHALFKKITHRAKLINNGTRLHKFGPPSLQATTQDMVYLGRFSSNKRLPWLIREYAKLANPAGVLKIIGRSKTGDSAQMVNLIKELGCEDRVKLIMDISDEEILNHIQSSRFTVSASEYEGFGLGVIELMSYGLVPFLSSQPASFNDFVSDSQSGELFDYSNGSFHTHYERLISRWAPAAAERAFEYANQFSWKTVAEEIFDVYTNAIEFSVSAHRKASYR